MEDITFVVHREWLENIAGLPVEQQDKVIAELVRYGTEIEMEYEDNVYIQAVVNMLKNRIDYSKDKYEEKIERGKNGGRKKKLDDEKIYQLAIEGKTAKEIAEIMGCSKSAIDHNEGWKRRKQKLN